MSDTTYREGWVEANGLQLHYLEWGRENLPPLVCLHGLQGQAHAWDEFAPAMADRYHVYALEHRGHSESQRAGEEGYSLELFASDFAQAIAALNLGPFTLVGHSLGGITGIAYVSQPGNRVERLIIGDIGPEASEEWTKGWANLPPPPLEFDSPDDVVTYVKEVDTVNAWYAQDDARRRGLAKNIRQRDDGKWVWRADLRLFTEDLSKGTLNLWPQFSKVTCPMLLIRGAESVLVSDDILRRMKEANPRLSSADVPGAGHGVYEDQPAAVLEKVRQWLEETG